MTKARILADYVAGGTTAAEFDYMDGVTSNVQTQLDAKLALAGGTMTGDLVPATPLSHRNMIINGDMTIAQRNTSDSGIGGTSAGYFNLDRWRFSTGGSTPSRMSVAQTAITDLAGFAFANKFDCTTASASPGADDEVRISQRIEGFNVQQIGKGISGANAVTVSFYVKGTASRTYMVELADNTNSEICQQQFTTTTSWVRHTFVCPARTSGGTLANTNANVMELSFFLHAGSDRTSGTYNANTWKTTVTADRAVGLSNSGAGLMQTTSDELYITGVQLELGSNATPFEHRSYGDELQRCQRYAVKFGGVTAYDYLGIGGYNTSGAKIHVTLPQMMRAEPIVESTGTVGHWTASTDHAGFTITGISKAGSVHDYNHITLDMAFGSGSNGTQYSCWGNNNTSAKIIIAAEL